MPICCKDAFLKRRVIIDCTEFFREVPFSHTRQTVTLPSDKNHNTTPNRVTFIISVFNIYVMMSHCKNIVGLTRAQAKVVPLEPTSIRERTSSLVSECVKSFFHLLFFIHMRFIPRFSGHIRYIIHSI